MSFEERLHPRAGDGKFSKGGSGGKPGALKVTARQRNGPAVDATPARPPQVQVTRGNAERTTIGATAKGDRVSIDSQHGRVDGVLESSRQDGKLAYVTLQGDKREHRVKAAGPVYRAGQEGAPAPAKGSDRPAERVVSRDGVGAPVRDTAAPRAAGTAEALVKAKRDEASYFNFKRDELVRQGMTPAKAEAAAKAEPAMAKLAKARADAQRLHNEARAKDGQVDDLGRAVPGKPTVAPLAKGETIRSNGRAYEVVDDSAGQSFGRAGRNIKVKDKATGKDAGIIHVDDQYKSIDRVDTPKAAPARPKDPVGLGTSLNTYSDDDINSELARLEAKDRDLGSTSYRAEIQRKLRRELDVREAKAADPDSLGEGKLADAIAADLRKGVDLDTIKKKHSVTKAHVADVQRWINRKTR